LCYLKQIVTTTKKEAGQNGSDPYVSASTL